MNSLDLKRKNQIYIANTGTCYIINLIEKKDTITIETNVRKKPIKNLKAIMKIKLSLQFLYQSNAKQTIIPGKYE